MPDGSFKYSRFGADKSRERGQWFGPRDSNIGEQLPMHRILLVEDSKFLKIATQRTLIKAGYEVVTAEDGEEAVQMASETLPDLILLDMLLPKLDGPQVLARLKANLSTASIPVVVLSGLSDKNAPKLVEAGASGFVHKGLLTNDAATLLALIHKLVSCSHANAVPPTEIGTILSAEN